jgi:hypothetical protein
MCREFEARPCQGGTKKSLTEYFLQWAGASIEPAPIQFTMNKLDAAPKPLRRNSVNSSRSSSVHRRFPTERFHKVTGDFSFDADPDTAGD